MLKRLMLVVLFALLSLPCLAAEAREYIGEFYITAYCSCYECCGAYALNRPGGVVIGSGQVELFEGKHVASSLPNGMKVYIAGIGSYEVQDTPAKHIVRHYDNRIIDIYFSDHAAAQKFGVKKAKVYREG